MATIDELRARAELIAEEQQIGGNTAERIGDAFDMVADIIEAVAPGDEQAVLYNPQTPNETQKAQARANIGAQEAISDIADFVKVSAQTFTAAQKQQARENIGAEEAGGAVKNLAGSASDTETLIKAANNPNLQANVHLSGNNIYVNGIAGGIDLDNNGVNIKAGNSGYPNAKVKVNGQDVATELYVDGKIDDRADPIELALAAIEAVIPSQATAQNQLADKNFVNSSISSSTANFVGTFNSLSELQSVQNPTNNDYGFVIETDAVGNEYYDRYKYNGTSWLFEYKVESTAFTAAQWAAIQSGITSALVTKLSALPTNAELTTALDAKADKSDTYTKAQVDAAIAAIDVSSQISGKADKVANAVNGDFAGLDANGNLTDSGKKASDFQVALVSGQNIKTINGNSLLGSGNISIEGGGGSDDAVLYTAQTLTDGQKAQARTNIDAYNMPNGGIPASDLDDDVQTTLTNVGVNANAIDELRAAYAALTQSDIVVVADHTAVTTPAQNMIYREPGTTSYSDWMYYGGAWVKMAEYNNAIDDTPTEGSANLVKSGGVFDKVKALGDYWTLATAAQTLAGKYIQYTNGSIATASSTPTFTTIFVEIPASADVDKVNIAIPKTTSTAGAIYGYANSLSATSVSGKQGRGNAGAQTIEVDVNHNYAYIVVCYNSAGGDPVVKFHTGLTDLSHFVKDSEISRDLSGVYGIGDLRISGEYINKTGGVASGYSNFKRSNYLPIYGSTKVVVSCAYTSTSATIVSFYDASKTWISGVLAATQNAQEYNVPVGAEYIVLSNKDNGAISLEFSSDGVAGFAGTLNNIADNITLPKRYTNILYVGNSFTANACAYIPTICNAVGAADVNLNYIEVAGASLQTYISYLSSGTLTPTISRGAKVAANGNLSSILAHDWDVIIFQQVSAQADDYSTYTPYLAQLVNAARKNCTNAGVKIAFGVVWGTYMSTYADIISAAKQMIADYDIDIVVPLGTSVENARGTEMAEGANSFSSDANIQHLANGVGKYVAACALYTAVMAELTGKSVYEDTTTTITTSGGLGEVDVTAENRALCQACAVYAAIYRWAALDVESL